MKVKLVQDSWRQMEAALMNRIHFVCLFLCLTFVARPAHSQTETVLYNFGGSPDGANPASSLTTDGKGNFYGTTLGGENLEAVPYISFHRTAMEAGMRRCSTTSARLPRFAATDNLQTVR